MGFLDLLQRWSVTDWLNLDQNILEQLRTNCVCVYVYRSVCLTPEVFENSLNKWRGYSW